MQVLLIFCHNGYTWQILHFRYGWTAGRLCSMHRYVYEILICHYENTPIQIYRKFHFKKTENFQIKNSDIFHISAQNIYCGYSLEPPRRGGSNEYPQSMFLSRNKKNKVYPCKPQFYYIKGGSKLYRHVFVMLYLNSIFQLWRWLSKCCLGILWTWWTCYRWTVQQPRGW